MAKKKENKGAGASASTPPEQGAVTDGWMTGILEMQNDFNGISERIKKAVESIENIKIHIAYTSKTPVYETKTARYFLSATSSGIKLYKLYIEFNREVSHYEPIHEQPSDVVFAMLRQLPAFINEYNQYIRKITTKTEYELNALLEQLKKLFQ